MSIERTPPMKPIDPVQLREMTESTQPKAKTDADRPQSGATQVQLSSMQAKLLQPDATDINMLRVAELKLAIRNGELTMDTGKIADALLKDAQDLLQD